MHGVQGEQPPGQAQRGNHLLGSRDLVALLGDGEVAEDDPLVGGKGAQDVRRLAVVEGVEAAAQGLAVDGNRQRRGACLAFWLGQTGGMVAECPFHLVGIKTLQNEPHRRVGRGAAQRQAEACVQPGQVSLNEGVDLPIRPGSRQHRQHREQQDRPQRIHFPLIAAGIGNLGKQRQQRARYRQPPERLPSIDSDKTRFGNRLFQTTSRRSERYEFSVEQPWSSPIFPYSSLSSPPLIHSIALA